jgi:uncharacterized tellurite resistance protein B-like protein
MEQAILDGFSDMEKGAYLCALASMATADRVATSEELEFITALADKAGISEEQRGFVQHAATTEITDADLNRCLNILKNSDLRFSLVSDIIAFAQADNHYANEEKQKVEQIAAYLGVNHDQFSVLDEFTKKAASEAPNHEQKIESGEETGQGFLGSLGLGDKLKKAGINTDSLFKGALGIIGPFLLARMFSGGRRKGGGMLGGLGGLLAGGGLLGGLLGGGRGFGGLGGMLGRLMGKK